MKHHFSIHPIVDDGATSSFGPAATTSQTSKLSAVTAMLSVSAGGRELLILYDAKQGAAACYAASGEGKWLDPVDTAPSFGAGWDILEPFVIGNAPHIIAYRASTGLFNLFPLHPDSSVGKPAAYQRVHPPAATAGFTTVKPFNTADGVAMLGYNFATGDVALFTISVTPRSEDGAAPIIGHHVWFAQWAKGWTRYAFFQFGGANFFLKTNVAVPNVNIDHIQDGLVSGTIEVRSHLDLQDAQALSLVGPVTSKIGDPGFFAYHPDGNMVLYRIRGDCFGWSPMATTRAVAKATHACVVTTKTASAIIVCSGDEGESAK